MIFRKCLLAAGLAVSLVLVAATASAQSDWPQKPVRIVVPYVAGGTADMLGRQVANLLSNAFGQPFVVENKGGAAGLIGSQQVARSAPDGYTLLVSGLGSHVVAPVNNQNSFDAMKDFTHIAFLGGPPTVLAVNVSSPVKNVKELISHAKNMPNGLSWGAPGVGTHGHLIGELFRTDAKLDMVHISYKGASPAVTDLLGNQIQAVFVTMSSAGAQIKAGKLRGIAVTADKRLDDYPDIPTFAESGYPKLTAMSWFSLSGPAGMPASVVNRLNTEVQKALASPDVRKKLANEGVQMRAMDAAAFTKFFASEIEFWTPYVSGLPKEK
jgi:tripartite-type tricarboxylate transporter receptor subunit TctC